MPNDFRRHLNKEALRKVRENPKLAALVQYCRADPSLSIFLRGSTLDVYWEGFVVFHVVISSGRIRIEASLSDLLALRKLA